MLPVQTPVNLKTLLESTMLRLCRGPLVKLSMVKNSQLLKMLSATVVARRNLCQRDRLPSLPVPSLQRTCELYLDIVAPVVETHELRRTRELVEEFQRPGGIGERLQRGLEQKACNTENWLTEDYVRTEYLEQRKPLVIFSNTGILFPPVQFQPLAVYCLYFLIETLPLEYIAGQQLCTKQCKLVMSSSRVPGLKTDSLAFYSKSANNPKHITVVHKCQFFKMDVFGDDGAPLTIDQLCAQLERICSFDQTNVEPVGILTTQHRDTWSKAYMNLIKDDTNKESVEAIQSSIFTMCLDGAMPPVSDQMNCNTPPLQMMHGGGSKWNSGNRWFDKGMQLIVAEDGTCGANGCHTIADGVTALIIADHVVEFMRKPQTIQPTSVPLPVPQKLHFNITPVIKEDIDEAKQHMDMLAQNLALSITTFNCFGKNVLKAYQMSPDSFVQMAIQLAHYRMHRRCSPTLEPVALNMYRQGRLGFINSNTSASVAFVKAFDDTSKQNLDKVDLLKKAINAHKWYIKMGLSGQVTQAHLFGLKMQAIVQGITMPGIFTDISYAKAFDYQVCTSQVTSKSGSVIYFAPEEPYIFNVSYGLHKDHIDLAVTRFENSKASAESNVAHMVQAVQDALLDMRILLDHTPKRQMGQQMSA
ncbi:uncharacterized protein V6R79_026216 [Siganus canaliculatus]